jgi:DNA-directed RNA polymerase specialized sigma subunit
MRLESKVDEFQKTGDSALGAEILSKSYHLAETIINKKYKNFGFSEDLLSESHDAIVAAIYAFDIDRKARFLTFCSTCINNRIKNFIQRKTTTLKLDKYTYNNSFSKDNPSTIDIKDCLSELSDSHQNALLFDKGSRPMKTRAKQKFFKKYNKDE